MSFTKFSPEVLDQLRSGHVTFEALDCIMDYGQFSAALEAEDEFQATLPKNDPRHKTMIEVSDDREQVTVYWNGGGYDIELSRIKKPEDILEWVVHIGTKRWKHITAYRLAKFVETVCRAKGWDPHGPFPHPNSAPPAFIDAAAEREKMTPALRYSIIRRDGYRCRACGASVSTGAHLHVDHIIAVSKGGRSEASNLQTLCSACNQGKAAQ